MKNHLREPAVH